MSSAARPSATAEVPEADAECEVDAVVVGAGFGGMYAIHRLRESGLSVVGFDTAPDVGGTWYWNRYPGARCDIPSPLYAYSWSAKLRNEWQWSEMFSGQPEILRYAQFIADKLDLRRSIKFETRVLSASFDDTARLWTVTTDHGEQVRARYCVMASGNLSVPHTPDIPGIETFDGETLFTAQWPHRTVDLAGKRVGVIGTGSSGIQVIPMIAESARELVVFQRTPSFSLPARNRPLDDSDRQSLEASLPRHIASLDAGRVSAAAFGAPVPDRDEQWARYERLWKSGGVAFLAGGYPNVLTDQRVNDVAAEFIRTKIRQDVDDPSVAEDLCPTQYPFGVKRPCLDTNYYRTFNRPNVTLVNLRRTPIAEVTATSIRTTASEYELDTLVFATGFDAMTGALLAVDIKGSGGITLGEAWADGPHAYLGIAVSGFPNLFTLAGPGSLSVIGNVILNNEHHVDWLLDLISYAQERGLTRIEAEADAEAAWMTDLADTADKTLYPQADSWYLGANIPGKPRIFMPYIGAGYRTRCSDVATADYKGFTLS